MGFDTISPMQQYLQPSIFVFLFLGFSLMVFHLKYLMLICMLTSACLAFSARNSADLKNTGVGYPSEINQNNSLPTKSKTIE